MQFCSKNFLFNKQHFTFNFTLICYIQITKSSFTITQTKIIISSLKLYFSLNILHIQEIHPSKRRIQLYS